MKSQRRTGMELVPCKHPLEQLQQELGTELCTALAQM